MKLELIELLRCPKTGQRLNVQEADSPGPEITSGWLVSEDGLNRYPVRDSIPRFAAKSNHADSLGMQWSHFRRTQLDSYSGPPISADRFWKATGWSSGALKLQWALDVGCGAGRFAEVALNVGANVVALDYSSAADACQANLGHHPSLHVVQGDVSALPLAQASFPLVYSLGVLQHTPHVAAAFASLPPMVRGGGRLCVDFYEASWKSILHSKCWLRPVTRRVPKLALFSELQKAVPLLLPLSRLLGSIPLAGGGLKRMVPVANYFGVLSLSDQQHREWSLVDTFDWLSPQYDQPQTAATVRRRMESAGMKEIEVLKAGHLVARGRK